MTFLWIIYFISLWHYSKWWFIIIHLFLSALLKQNLTPLRLPSPSLCKCECTQLHVPFFEQNMHPCSFIDLIKGDAEDMGVVSERNRRGSSSWRLFYHHARFKSATCLRSVICVGGGKTLNIQTKFGCRRNSSKLCNHILIID